MKKNQTLEEGYDDVRAPILALARALRAAAPTTYVMAALAEALAYATAELFKDEHDRFGTVDHSREAARELLAMVGERVEAIARVIADSDYPPAGRPH